MRMRYIKGLTRETLKMLDRIYKQSKYYQQDLRKSAFKTPYVGVNGIRPH